MIDKLKLGSAFPLSILCYLTPDNSGEGMIATLYFISLS